MGRLDHWKVVVISSILVAFVVFSLFVPVIPSGGYGPDHKLPNQIFVQTRCYDTGCPIVTTTGQSWVSISYALFGVGEYPFVNATHFTTGPLYIKPLSSGKRFGPSLTNAIRVGIT